MCVAAHTGNITLYWRTTIIAVITLLIIITTIMIVVSYVRKSCPGNRTTNEGTRYHIQCCPGSTFN